MLAVFRVRPNTVTPILNSQRCLWLQVVMGDILSDLPRVSNFTFAESAEYASQAQTPLQLWFQRDPPSWQASRASRGQRADAFMREGHAALEKKIRKGEHDFRGIETVSLATYRT